MTDTRTDTVCADPLELLTVDEVARLLKLEALGVENPADRVRYLAKRHGLRLCKLLGRSVVFRADLDAFLADLHESGGREEGK